MQVKKLLEDLRYIKLEIKELQEAKHAALALCRNTTVQNHEYINTLTTRIDTLNNMLNTGKELINRLDDGLEKQLLIKRYIDCKTWEQIAEELYFSDRWLSQTLHKRALDKLEKVFPPPFGN